MVRASLDRQIDTTVIVASCFPLVEQVSILTDRQTDRQTETEKTETQIETYRYTETDIQK